MDCNIINLANFDMVDKDAYLICPFDPIHKIIAKRFPYHIMKCRKNWNGRSMLTCCFNARHIVPASEHRHHIKTCPDKKCIEADFAYQQRIAGVHQTGHMTKGCTSLPSYDRDQLEDDDEDWDNECADEGAVGYYPDDYQGPPVYQNLTGYTAGEKRQFHKDIGTVHFQSQEHVDGHPSRPYPTDSDQSGHVHQPYMTNHTDIGSYQPHARQTDSATNMPYEQQQSTASGFEEQQSGLRLPRQPAKASVVVKGTDSSAQPKTKKGGRIAANIFSAGDASNVKASGTAQAETAQTQAGPPAVNAAGPAQPNAWSTAQTQAGPPQPNAWSTPLAINNQTSVTGQVRPPPGFSRPAVGIGRGLVPPGVGRGFVPGIGRGLIRGDATTPGQIKK